MSMLYSSFVVAGTAIFAFMPGFWGKIIGRFVFGLGMEPLEVCQDAIIVRWFGAPLGGARKKRSALASLTDDVDTASVTTGTENEADLDYSEDMEDETNVSGTPSEVLGPAGPTTPFDTLYPSLDQSEPNADLENEELEEEEEDLESVAIDSSAELDSSDSPKQNSALSTPLPRISFPLHMF